jgi:hypothetical protein
MTPEHVITPPEAEIHHSTAKENKYTPIATKTGVHVTPQNKKNNLKVGCLHPVACTRSG